jgi:NAD(P)-dependent dehydrogenase (short-subunit alcohol dehydrogenase family)
MNPSFSFDDTSVLVTGGTSGIGAAIAEAFGRCGARTMISGRNAGRGSAVCETIRKAGGHAEFLGGDVTDSSFCNRLVRMAAQRFGGLDVLVNSAGIIRHATAEETTDEQWHDTLAANVNGTFYSCRAAIPVMRKGGGGVIVNIASDAGLTGSPHLVAYCASKGAVIQMTRALAIDHGRDNIRVVALCPGDVDTPMLRGEFISLGIDAETGLQRSADSVPLGKVGSREEVASLALYVASDAAGFMTGTTVTLDGGSRA